jgi:hypothetical protein
MLIGLKTMFSTPPLDEGQSSDPQSPLAHVEVSSDSETLTPDSIHTSPVTDHNDASREVEDSGRPMKFRRGATAQPLYETKGIGTKRALRSTNRETRGKRKLSNIEVAMPRPIFPKSVYEFCNPPASVYTENEVLDEYLVFTFQPSCNVYF